MFIAAINWDFTSCTKNITKCSDEKDIASWNLPNVLYAFYKGTLAASRVPLQSHRADPFLTFFFPCFRFQSLLYQYHAHIKVPIYTTRGKGNRETKKNTPITSSIEYTYTRIFLPRLSPLRAVNFLSGIRVIPAVLSPHTAWQPDSAFFSAKITSYKKDFA